MSEATLIRPPGSGEHSLHLSFPEEGVPLGAHVLRVPEAADLPAIAPAFADDELREAGNLPAFAPGELEAHFTDLPLLVTSGRLLPLVVADDECARILGGGSLHHLDGERGIIEIGYWLYPRARGCGVATRLARALAEHSFMLGIQRVAAYVNVGNLASERVLARAGFTREGVVRSLPKPDGRRVDKTLFSLLPGE